MDKLDFKKAYKDLYLPKSKPSIINVPPISFIMLEGEGDPNSQEFTAKVEALYSFSYTVKMSYKRENPPEGFYNYSVFPLEGVWDLIDYTLPSTDKSNYKYTIMIRQPEFLSASLFTEFLAETKKKKPSIHLDKIKYNTLSEGLCCQILHLGSYDNEPESFRRMEEFCKNNGYERISLKHREIYLSDPRRTEVAKLKTVLRFQVKVNQ